MVSNPPYVDAADRDALAPEVRDHEPALALFPPGDALLFYRRLAAEAPALLRPGGWLAVEVGAGQAAAVAALFDRADLAAAPPTSDLAGIPRVIAATRR